MDENVVEVGSVERELSSVRHLGALVQDHLSGLQDDLLLVVLEVDQGQGPVLVDLLVDLQDGAEDVRQWPIDVKTHRRAVEVAPDAVETNGGENKSLVQTKFR